MHYFGFKIKTPAMLYCFLVVLMVINAGCSMTKQHELSSTETQAQDIIEIIHGQKIADPYRWLESNNSAIVKDWEKTQNKLTGNYFDQIQGKEILTRRLTDLFDVPWIGSPLFRNGRMFYHAQPKGAQQDILYWRYENEQIEHVLIDPNRLSDQPNMGADTNINLGRWSVTRDGQTIAYVLKPNNADEGHIEVMDIDSGEISAIDRLDGIKHSRMEWTVDGSGFYYTHLPNDPNIDEALRPGLAQIKYHQLGTSQDEDKTIFHATNDPTTFLRPRVSFDGHWLFIYVWKGWTGVSVYLRDLRIDDSPFKLFYESDNATMWVFDHGNYFYIHTNEDAPNQKLLRVKKGIFDRTKWEEIIAENPDAVLQRVHNTRSHLLAVYLKDAHHQLKIFNLQGEFISDVDLPAPGSTQWIRTHPERDDAYYTFSSYTHPWQTFRLTMQDGKNRVWSDVAIPVDTDRYQVQQDWFSSKDGTKVPMFIIRDSTKALDGSTAFLLYGYGGFNYSLFPRFSSAVQPWLEAGGGYAVVNLRGGGEFGEDWHRAGMRKNKQNVFDDFIAAAEHLIDKGYTRPDRLAIYGRSNGGLLVGAAMTQRPDLFGAVICGVPLTDMIRYTALGVGKTWIEEYGDPEIEDDFNVLAAYSPYHHIIAGTHYPATLITTADHDDRVHPAHARKFTAALQSANPGNNLVLLSIEQQAGHSGAGKIDDNVRNWTRKLLFLMNQFDLKPKSFN